MLAVIKFGRLGRKQCFSHYSFLAAWYGIAIHMYMHAEKNLVDFNLAV